MITITNINQLPQENMHAFSFATKEDAQRKATQYALSWYYESIHMADLKYLYVLQSEWEEKQVKS